MFYTVYETKNLVNQKTYIGTHVTSNPEDDYLGSGSVLLKAIKKYGTKNFTKKILYVFSDAVSMFDKERELVNEDFIRRHDTYNVKLGGSGGWDYINANSIGDRQKGYLIAKKFMTCPEKNRKAGLRNKELGKGIFARSKEQMSRDAAKSFTGKKHLESSKRLIGNKNSVIQSGSGNSQFGKRWMTKDGANKSVHSNDTAAFLEDGWIFGRNVK